MCHLNILLGSNKENKEYTMKILIIISNPEMGGAQRVAINLTEWLNLQLDTKAMLLSLTHTSKRSYDISKVNGMYLNEGSVIMELCKLLKQERPDIVLTMGVPLSLYTVPACLLTHTKHIISERNDPANFAGKWITKITSRSLMRLAQGFVFQTHDAQLFYKGKISSNSVIIHNPLFNIDDDTASLFEGNRKKEIVTAGRLISQKNHNLLIESFKEVATEFPEYKLIIYGEGNLLEILKRKVNELNLTDKILFPGAQKDILNKIKESALFVLPSNFEGMPNALMEAMSLGLPCISTDCPCGGPSEIIKNKENGILVPVNNKKELAQAIRYMLCDPGRAELMGKKASQIRDSHNINVICKQWLEYFRYIVYDK